MDTLEKEIQEKFIHPLEGTVAEFKDAREKYFNFQLQLITISAATFSIYLAFGKNTSSNLTKWGFVFLSVSLILGLLSIILRFVHSFANIFFKVFDAEKHIFSDASNKELKNLLAKTSYLEPIFYDKELDGDFLPEHKKIVFVSLKKFFKSSINSWIFLFGILQLCAILVAAILLLIGLLQIPIL